MKFKFKTTFIVIFFTVFAIGAAILVRQAYRSVAYSSDENSASSQFEDQLLITRDMFKEKADDIQTLTASLISSPAVTVLRSADGIPMLAENGAAVSEFTMEDASAEAGLKSVFGEFKCGGTLYNIETKSDAVLFYTYYNSGACIGFLYEKEPGTTSYYNYLELVENWKLFYQIPNE